MARASNNLINVNASLGANESVKSAAYTLVVADYGQAANKTIVYTGTGGEAFTHANSSGLSSGDYVWIEHRGTGILEVDFTNASDRIGATSLGRDNLYLSPAEKVLMRYTATANVWSVE